MVEDEAPNGPVVEQKAIEAAAVSVLGEGANTLPPDLIQRIIDEMEKRKGIQSAQAQPHQQLGETVGSISAVPQPLTLPQTPWIGRFAGMRAQNTAPDPQDILRI